MTYAKFQECFEQEAGKEKERYDSLPVSQLIADIASRKFGGYFQIWYSLAERAKVLDVGWLLFDILRSDEEYLTRYHCAAAVISIAGLYSDGFRAEQLSARPKYRVDERLEEVKEILERQLGRRAESGKRE